MPSGSSSILSIIHQGCRSAAAGDTAEGAGRRVERPACSGRWAGAPDRRAADSGAVSHEAVVPELDRFVHAAQGRVTGGMSPVSAGLAALDWAVHLADSPAYRTRLAVIAARMGARLTEYAARRALGQVPPPCARPRPGDRRSTTPHGSGGRPTCWLRPSSWASSGGTRRP